MTTNDARGRVRAIADGATINGTYQKLPIAALDAFKADLRAVLDQLSVMEEALREIADLAKLHQD